MLGHEDQGTDDGLDGVRRILEGFKFDAFDPIVPQVHHVVRHPPASSIEHPFAKLDPAYQCPTCQDCPEPSTASDHEPWWWAMCTRWEQCPNDPDAFWQFDRRRFKREKALAQADPDGYASEA